VSSDVKALYSGTTTEYVPDLCFKPYDYQDDVIKSCLKTGKGIIRAATASGKSVMISYVVKTLYSNGLFTKGVIIVPTIGLVTQFYDDMREYGMDMSLIGRVGDDWREWDKTIIISTWQSIQNDIPKHMCDKDLVIVDECLSGDTMISTPQGTTMIEQLSPGDIITSYNIEKDQYEDDLVVEVFRNMSISGSEKMYKLEFDNGTYLEVTGNHKILTMDGYVRADQLTTKHDII
jgi:hypothetical protein